MSLYHRSFGTGGRLNRFRIALALTLALAASGLLGALCGVPAMVAGAHAAENSGNANPVSAHIEIQPMTLTGPQSVQVSINVQNIGDDELPGALVLYDPANERVSTFGSGGSMQLAMGEQRAWTGEWYITQDQLAAGSITYKLQYPRIVDGQAQNATTNVTARFTYNKPVNHKLNVQRSYTPASPEEGQTVTMEYSFENTGDVNLLNLYIEDKGVGIKKEDLFTDSLIVGAKITKSFSFTMGAATVSSQPTIYYTPEGLDKSVSGTVQKVITITPTKIDITATLTASKDVVNRGDSVNLVCEIKNGGSVAYKEIKISDATLGVIAQNISLGAKKTYKETKSIKVSAPGTYKFDITGVDANGNPLTLSSNEITVHTREDAKPVSLEISIEADRDVIYTDPATAIFVITVRNTGEEIANEIIVSAAEKKVYTIPQLKPGESDVRAKEFTLFMGGRFRFDAAAKNSLGVSQTFNSNETVIVYQAPKPTPSPTPTMTPTPTPVPTPTPALIVEDLDEPGTGSFGQVLLWVLGGLLVVILGGVGAMFMLDRRRVPAVRAVGGSHSSSGIEVIDHLDRTPRRDYTRTAKSAAKAAALPVLSKVFSKRSRTEGGELENSQYAPLDDSMYAPPEALSGYDDIGGIDDIDDMIEPEIASLNDGGVSGRYLEPDDTHRIDTGDITRAAERYAPPPRKQEPRIEPEPVAEAKPVEAKADVAEPDPEAGSAGQYRLTRRAGTLRPKAEPSVSVESEDPANFAKKQRARRSREINTAQFYEDDE